VRSFGAPSIGFWDALMAASLVDYSAEALGKAFRGTLKHFTKASCHASPSSHLHRTPETDSPRPAGATSRMGPPKWRVPQVRFLRVTPCGTTRKFHANGIQRVYRCCSSHPRTGIKLNQHRSCWINQTAPQVVNNLQGGFASLSRSSLFSSPDEFPTRHGRAAAFYSFPRARKKFLANNCVTQM
jgi:hypothetical protein